MLSLAALKARPTDRIVCSPGNAVNLRLAAGQLRQALSHGEALLLAPTKAAADELARAACETGLLGLHRMTLTQLAADVAGPSVAQRKLAPLSRLGIEAVAAGVLHGVRRERALDYFEPVADTPGFARALASTLAELRLAGVNPDDLAAAGVPGADLERLFARFEAELERRSLADLAVLLRLALAEAARKSHRLLGLPLVLLDMTPSSTLEQRFLAAVVESAPSVLALALSGDEEGVRSLQEILGANAEEQAAAGSTTLDRVRTCIFLPELPPAATPDASFEIFSAAGEGLECVEIARRIQRLVGSGVAFDGVAILLRDPDRYQPLVEEALRRAAVPGYFSHGVARPDPAGRAFLALLQCAAEDCSAARFAEYLSLGQTPPLEAAPPAPPAWVAPEDELLGSFPPAPESADSTPVSTPAAWEKLLAEAAVIGSPDRWARRLSGLKAELRMRRDGLETEDDALRAQLDRRIEQLGRLEQFALPIISALAALPKQAVWGDWLSRLTTLAGFALRKPASVLSVLNELWPMKEVGPVGLDTVSGVLHDRLRTLRRTPPPRRYGRVFVGAIAEARGRSFDVVFLPGLAEGIFPRRAREDPLLLDAHRERMPGNLARRDRAVSAERLLLRIAAAAGERFVVSYPRMDAAKARPRVPSFYALEVVRAAQGSLPDLRTLEQEAARAAASRLGWPAPPDPDLAIDDAEYDLASLDRMLRLPAGGARTQGRYLVEVNPYLARSLRTRFRRWRAAWSEADGLLQPDAATRAVLARHRLAQRAYSPTTLQNFAACPYRFFLHGIHQLYEREEVGPLERMDPLTRGAIFHDVQAELFRELERAGLLPIGSERLEQTLVIANAVLDRVAAASEDELAPAIPRVWRNEIEELRADLRGWLQRAAPGQLDWLPVRFEFAFGLPRRGPSAPEATVLNGVRLRGAIDLVEQNAAGVLRVTDHKTGKKPETAPLYVGGGAMLQPVLYGLAAEQLLAQPVSGGRFFYCTHAGEFSEFEIPLDVRAREYARQALAIIDSAIEVGFLPAAPQRGACARCDYRLVCGPYEELRTSRKPKDSLVALEDLRGMP